MENEPKSKSPEELEKEFKNLENSIIELAASLSGIKLDQNLKAIHEIEEEHHIAQVKYSKGELSLPQVVEELRGVLKKLEKFVS